MLYRLFNKTIDADIPLPLVRCSAEPVETDLVFRKGVVPRKLTNPIHEEHFYQVAEDEFIVEIAGVARFWSRKGRIVVYERMNTTDDRDIALFLLGSILGAVLLQRGEFLLHACAVATDEGAILISGESGTGKSTLTAGLVRQGYRLIADDTCLLTLVDGVVFAHPGYPHIRLWAESLTLLGIPTNGLSRVLPREDKYYWPVDSLFMETPQPVKAFFELAPWNGTELLISPLSGVDKILVLARNTYRNEFIKFLSSYEENIAHWASVARCFLLFRLMRPLDRINIGGVTCNVDATVKYLMENKPWTNTQMPKL